MSLWRPIMCRTSQMFPPPAPPTRSSSSVATDLSVLTGSMSSYFQHASQSVGGNSDALKTPHPNNSAKNCLPPNNNNNINKMDSHQMAHPVSIASPTTIGTFLIGLFASSHCLRFLLFVFLFFYRGKRKKSKVFHLKNGRVWWGSSVKRSVCHHVCARDYSAASIY